MFSKTCEYAIRAMIFVAKKSKSDIRVGIKAIANGTDAPEHFMAKVMQELSRKKLVKSIKGPNGGFYMDERLYSTPLSEIVKAIDGEGYQMDCVLGLKTCSEICPCPVHFEYKNIKKELIKMLENNTIGEFNEKILSGKFFLSNKKNENE